MSIKTLTASAFLLTIFTSEFVAAEDVVSPDYNSQIAPIFRKYCNGCHNADDAEGKLVLDDFASLLKGGKSGASIVAGKSSTSKLILVLEKKAEPFMPPEGSDGPSNAEIELLKRWIDEGAKGPTGRGPDPNLLVTPKVPVVGDARNPIQAVTWAPNGRMIAMARYKTVEIVDAKTRKITNALNDHAAHVNDLCFSQDGKLLAVTSGEPGLFGETKVWRTSDWTVQHTLQGHRDSLYAVAISPQSKVLATAGYDQLIKLWDLKSGKELFTLKGHNGPIFDLDFHPSGSILASASGDMTVKLWDVQKGERLDTLNQPEKYQYTVAFSPNGRHVAAGGVDNRIRVWEIRAMGKEGTNPIHFARFSHDKPILALAYSPDGKTLLSSSEDHSLKLWNAETLELIRKLDRQSDWAPAVTFSPDSQDIFVGRMDGSTSSYKLNQASQESAIAAVPVSRLPVPTSHHQDGQMPKDQPEQEPNDTTKDAMQLKIPTIVTGTFAPNAAQPEDVDLFSFEAKEGESWVIETTSAEKISLADTRIEVLHEDGQPVEQLLLRAVRDSYITFRPIDSSQTAVRVKNWEEMELNQFVYMSGEVCKWHRMPQGPDSGMEMYKVNGKRECYFGTSATVHALEEPIYIVEPYKPGTQLADNGLPIFPLYYTNDDSGTRRTGIDSQLTFTPPKSGRYLLRVTDVRGFGGPKFQYSLAIRPPKPSFTGKVIGGGMTIGRGSSQRFAVQIDRIDGFGGDVQFEIANLPAGFHVSTPIVVQAGHLDAEGVVSADLDAMEASKQDWEKVTITATGTLHGEIVAKQIGDLGEIKLAERPKAIAHLEREAPSDAQSTQDEPIELVITPGSTITAMVRVDRFDDFKNEIRFDVENLPHGVIVDNLGLSGIMVREGEDRRQIFITAADWVPESTRWIHAVARSAGKQASRPILFRVQQADSVARIKK